MLRSQCFVHKVFAISVLCTKFSSHGTRVAVRVQNLVLRMSSCGAAQRMGSCGSAQEALSVESFNRMEQV